MWGRAKFTVMLRWRRMATAWSTVVRPAREGGRTVPSGLFVCLTGLWVKGGKEGAVGTTIFEAGDKVPEGSCLVEVAY